MDQGSKQGRLPGRGRFESETKKAKWPEPWEPADAWPLSLVHATAPSPTFFCAANLPRPPASFPSEPRENHAALTGEGSTAGLSLLPTLACDPEPEGATGVSPGMLRVQRGRGRSRTPALPSCPPSRVGWGVRSPEPVNRTSEQVCAGLGVQPCTRKGHGMGAHSGHPCQQLSEPRGLAGSAPPPRPGSHSRALPSRCTPASGAVETEVSEGTRVGEGSAEQVPSVGRRRMSVGLSPRTVNKHFSTQEWVGFSMSW